MKNWQLKRNDNKVMIGLHGQYWWSDEYSWSSLAQSAPSYSITGAMFIQQGTMKAGRPITLDCSHARTTRGIVKQLQAWSQVPELEMTLTHPDGRKFNVAFARPAISDERPVKNLRPADQSDDDPYVANIHLMTI